MKPNSLPILESYSKLLGVDSFLFTIILIVVVVVVVVVINIIIVD